MAPARNQPPHLRRCRTVVRGVKLVEEVGAAADKNPIFKKLYESMSAFRDEQYAWHQVCEVTYDSYMVRKRSRT